MFGHLKCDVWCALARGSAGQKAVGCLFAVACLNPLRWLLTVHAIFEPLPPRPLCVRVGGEELESLPPAPHEANLLLN